MFGNYLERPRCGNGSHVSEEPKTVPIFGSHANGGRMVMRGPRGNVRGQSSKDIRERSGALRFTRDLRATDLRGFCKTCQYAQECSQDRGDS